MSDITLAANRVIPLDVELYDRVITEFPAQNVIGRDDTEIKLLFTLKNKNATTPYAVAASDVSSADKVEYVFTDPDGFSTIKTAGLNTTGSDGIIYYMTGYADLSTRGNWYVTVRVTFGDVTINYPRILFIVE